MMSTQRLRSGVWECYTAPFYPPGTPHQMVRNLKE
jgi:hypothetical protein